MFIDLADAILWIIRAALFGGIAWGAWLCIGHMLLPPRSEKMLQVQYFATVALVVILFSTLGGLMQAM